MITAPFVFYLNFAVALNSPPHHHQMKHKYVGLILDFPFFYR